MYPLPFDLFCVHLMFDALFDLSIAACRSQGQTEHREFIECSTLRVIRGMGLQRVAAPTVACRTEGPALHRIGALLAPSGRRFVRERNPQYAESAWLVGTDR